jgi:hypothetical protein
MNKISKNEKSSITLPPPQRVVPVILDHRPSRQSPVQAVNVYGQGLAGVAFSKVRRQRFSRPSVSFLIFGGLNARLFSCRVLLYRI